MHPDVMNRVTPENNHFNHAKNNIQAKSTEEDLVDTLSHEIYPPPVEAP